MPKMSREPYSKGSLRSVLGGELAQHASGLILTPQPGLTV